MLELLLQNIKDITQFAPTETFLNDTLLQNIEPKRAMIIVAHDDDMCGMAGTISKLNKDGWEIAVVSFQSHRREMLLKYWHAAIF